MKLNEHLIVEWDVDQGLFFRHSFQFLLSEQVQGQLD